MGKKWKNAILAAVAVMALGCCAETVDAAGAAALQSAVIKEGITDNGEGKSWQEVGRTFENAGSIETTILRAQQRGYLLFINTENVLVTGEVAVTGAKSSTEETFIEFQSTPAQIMNNAVIQNGSLMVTRYRGALERTGETTIIKGNVYLTGSNLETLNDGEWVMNGSLNVDGQNAHLIIEGDLYCSGSCLLQVERGGILEVRGKVMQSTDTTVIVDGETRMLEGGTGLTLMSSKEDPLKEFVSKGIGY